jgi:hypothetical protein
MTPRTLRRPLVTAAVLAVVAASAGPAEAQRPLHTGFLDPHNFTWNESTFAKARSAGATRVRLALYWVSVLNGAPRPNDPTRWDHPSYNWDWFDAQVRRAKAKGLEPIVSIQEAPSWATATGTGHIERPSHAELAAFARAAAVRYSGTKTPVGASQPLPAVRLWQVWNEPNRGYFLSPQVVDGRIVSADWYRGMVAAMGAAVRDVDARNRVVAGGLAPRARTGHPGPLGFMRALLCVSAELRRTCDLRADPVRLDVWAHHPYTPGAPTRKARGGGDVMISGLPRMNRLLRAAIRLGHVRGRGTVQFWVTEFGWDSAPPDPKALPMTIHARWTAEALYRMWKAGVSSVTWFRVQDDPMSVSPYQSGFFTASGRRKRSFTAFRFPVVAFRTTRGIRVWGRTPGGRRGTVQLDVRSGGAWRPLGRVGTSTHGVFRRTFGAPYRRGSVRARFRGGMSLPFSLKGVRDRYVEPFGSPLGRR